MAKRKPKKRVIRSNPDNVRRQDEWLAQLDARRRAPDLAPMRARRYRGGPLVGHPAQGGLPSLGKGY